LYLGEVAPDVAPHLVRVEVRPRTPDDDGRRPLAEPLVLDAEDGDLRDRRVHRLDLVRQLPGDAAKARPPHRVTR
jgi:hypothetical protein